MINKMILQGRLVRDPELKTTNTGLEVCDFTVAWSDDRKDFKTELFLDCTAWRQTGVFISQYFAKGKEIAVEGRLETQKYQDRQGNNRQKTILMVDRAHFCGKKSDGSAFEPAQQPANQFQNIGDLDDGNLPF